jgi:BolA protein
MTRAERIREALATLAPTELTVVDDSARHAGHAGASAAGETHFIVTVVSPAFTGRTRIERQRMVYQLVDAELHSGLHALQLTTRAPGEQPGPR